MVEHYASNIQNIIQTEIFRAQKSIKIAVSWFTNDLLFQPLLLKQNMGVQIELVLNQDEINCGISNPISFDNLTKVGGKLYWNTSRELMHDKFCIIDNNIVITGSYNWTNKAEFNKENISIFRGEPDTLQFYTNQFQKYIQLYGKVLNNHTKTTELGDVYACNNNVSVCKQYPFNRLNFVFGSFCIFSENGNSIIVVTKYEDRSRNKHFVSILDNDTLKPILPFENDDRSHPNLEHKTIWLWKNHRAALYSVAKRAYLTNHMFDSVTPGLGHFIVHFNNHYGLCDVTGKLIIPCEYDAIETTGVIKKGWKYGLIMKGSLYLDCIYDEINLDGHKPSRLGNKYGLLSDGLLRDNNKEFARRGTIILNFEYDEIYFHGYFDYDIGNFFVMRKGNSYGFYLPRIGHVEPCVHIARGNEEIYKESLFKIVTRKIFNQAK